LFKSRKWRSTINSRRPAPPRTQPAQHAHPSNHALMLHQHPVSPALVHHMPMNHALMLHQHPVSPALVHHMPMQVSPALVHHMPMHLSSAPSVSSTCPSHAHAPFIISTQCLQHLSITCPCTFHHFDICAILFCFLFLCVCVCVLLTGGGNGNVRGHLHTDGVGDTRGTCVRAMPKYMTWPSACSSVIEVRSSW
jgi:hypothetical protein